MRYLFLILVSFFTTNNLLAQSNDSLDLNLNDSISSNVKEAIDSSLLNTESTNHTEELSEGILKKFKFTDTIVDIGMTLTIDAIPYTNEVNKYDFDIIKVDSLAFFLSNNELVVIEVICNGEYSESPLLTMMATSEQANEIRNQLVRKGIKGSRIEVYGNGEMNLLVNENDKVYMDEDGIEKANRLNRRIEISILEFKEILEEKPVVEQKIEKPVDIENKKKKKSSKGVKSYPN